MNIHLRCATQGLDVQKLANVLMNVMEVNCKGQGSLDAKDCDMVESELGAV